MNLAAICSKPNAHPGPTVQNTSIQGQYCRIRDKVDAYPDVSNIVFVKNPELVFRVFWMLKSVRNDSK